MNTWIELLRNNARWLSAGVLLTFLSSFGQTFFISIFAGEIRTAFDLSHGEWGGIYSIGTTASAVAMIWGGMLTDYIRVRSLGALILIALGGACLFMAFNSVVWLLPFVVFALRFCGQGMASHIAVVAMARWFVAARGKALSIATLGYAFGEAILPLVFVSLLAIYDWRLLWVGAAVIAFAGVPILWALLKQERTPQSLAQSNESLGMQHRHWTRGEALKNRLFWFMVPALLGPSAFGTAFFFHQVHYAEIKDISHVALVALFPFYTGIGLVAMLISGAALDRWGTARLLPYYQLPMVLGFLCFAFLPGVWGTMLGLFFFGVTSGANTTLPAAFWAEFYGTKYIGSIKAAAAAIMVLGSAIGPGLTGGLIDFGVGIETQYIYVALYFVFSSAMMWIGIRSVRK